MSDAERVYGEWVEPRSFGCKKCNFLSSNRRVVEQHLRQLHPDLFESQPPAPAAPPSQDAPASPPEPAVTAVPPVTEDGRDVVLYTDAGTWDNGTPKQRSILAVWDGRTRAIAVHEELPGTTNNEAEYGAIIAALELARQDGLRGLLIRSDSQLCVNQILGKWQIKEERLRSPRDRAARLLREVGGRIEWVPRERNYAGIFLEKTYKGTGGKGKVTF